MQRKLTIARWLMILSLLILLLFQGYWLTEVYKDEFRSLRRELSVLLRETTMRHQFTRMMDTGRADTMKIGDATITMAPASRPPVRIAVGEPLKTVSSTPGTPPTRCEGEVLIRMTPPRDSSRGGRSRFFAIEQDRSGADTLASKLIINLPVPADWKPEMLDSLYRAALADNRIPLQMTLRKKDWPLPSDSLHGRDNHRQMTAGGSWPGFQLMEADFGNPFWYLLPRMTRPILWSILMLGLIGAAMWFMYRNLKAQERLTRLRNDFVSNMTHELKTPIATVGVAIEALRNFHAINDPERTREYLNISAQELDRLNLLVDKVLRLSMFEQDKLELQRGPVDLKMLAEEVLRSMKLQLEKTGAHVHLNTEGNLTVNGDRLHLMSVLFNLLDNALKYRSEQPVIHVHMKRDDGHVVCEVADNGPGIAAEYRTRVFDKFFRVPQGDRHDIKGYGLGLSYVAEVIRQHDGTITVDSEPGKGSTFRLRLPAA